MPRILFFQQSPTVPNSPGSGTWPLWRLNSSSRDPFSTSMIMGLLMEEILHQLRLVVYPIIYRVSDIPGGARFQPSTGGRVNLLNHRGFEAPELRSSRPGLFLGLFVCFAK